LHGDTYITRYITIFGAIGGGWVPSQALRRRLGGPGGVAEAQSSPSNVNQVDSWLVEAPVAVAAVQTNIDWFRYRLTEVKRHEVTVETESKGGRQQQHRATG
jgi:hypothetical protein